MAASAQKTFFYLVQPRAVFEAFFGVLLITYLTVVTLEYFGEFGTGVRAGLFFCFIGINLYILSKYIVIPTLKLQSFGNRINRYQASSIIGKFFLEFVIEY